MHMTNMIRKMIRKTKGENQKALSALSAMPIFVLPENVAGLMTCIFLFLIAALLIYLLEKLWMRSFVFKTVEAKNLQRILIWEFGTIVSIIGAFMLEQYYVVLPLLFLLAFLVMWYLVRVANK